MVPLYIHTRYLAMAPPKSFLIFLQYMACMYKNKSILAKTKSKHRKKINILGLYEIHKLNHVYISYI